MVAPPRRRVAARLGLPYGLGVQVVRRGRRDAAGSCIHPQSTEMASMIDRTRHISRILFAAAASLLLTACQPGGDSEQARLAEQNRLEGEKFLAENAQKPGVMTTPSGLQYQVLREGTGRSPTADDTVMVTYKGTFPSGEPFDDGEEISFPLNQVIAGWTEGLQMMKEGAHYLFFIPSDLAYGDAGAGNIVPPKATLVFDVELLKVNPEVATEDGGAEATPDQPAETGD